MMILGMNLLIGGLLVTILVAGEPISLPFITQQPLSQTVMLGFTLTVMGFIVLAAGFILVIHYDRQRTWYVGETTKSTPFKKGKNHVKPLREIIQEYAEDRKRS